METQPAIDVWRIDLSQCADPERHLPLLDADERARAGRFLAAVHRRRFIVAHAAVRLILAARLGVAADALHFARAAHGRPFLVGGGAEFSLSHSDELALCAVAAGGEFGIDVERCGELRDADLARRFFAGEEAAALAELPEPERREAFFAYWTRKEAYVKAKGQGLSLPLASFTVAADARGLAASTCHPADVGHYCFREIPVAAGYRAALAHPGRGDLPLRLLDWRFAA